MHIRHIVICGLPCSTIFFHIPKKGKIFEEKKIILSEICFSFSFATFIWNIFYPKKNWAR
jgi:hypothetical protein